MDIGGGRAAAAMHVAEVWGSPTTPCVRPSAIRSRSALRQRRGEQRHLQNGVACYQAAHDVKGQMIEQAAKLWEVTPDDVEYTKGSLVDRRNPERRLTFKELARRLNATGGPIIGRTNLAPRGVGPGFGFHIVDVEVNPETGGVPKSCAIPPCRTSARPSIPVMRKGKSGGSGPGDRLGV